MLLNKEENKNYYDIGNMSNIFISNSALNQIDPELGGHPKKFKEFIENKLEYTETKPMITGSVVHKYLENKSLFAVAEINKPEDKAGEICDYIIEQIKKADENTSIDEHYIFKSFSLARNFIDYYKSRTDDSTWGTFSKTDAIKYIQFEISNKNKVVLTKNNAEILDNISESISRNIYISPIINCKDSEICRVLNELEIYYTDTKFNYKLKIDKVIIDHENKTVNLYDYKTYSKSAITYAPTVILNSTEKTPFETRKTYRQVAFYKTGLMEFLIGHSKEFNITDEYKINVYIIVLETTGLYNCCLFLISESWLYKGRKEYQDLIEKVNFHKGLNNWNYYSEEIFNNGVLKVSKLLS